MRFQKITNSRFIFFLLFSACVIMFTGCPNSFTTGNKNTNKAADSQTIELKGSVVMPSAMSEASRSAVSAFTTAADGTSVELLITATATIEGEPVNVNNKFNFNNSNLFTLKIPKATANWSVVVELLANEKTVMRSQTKTISVSKNDTDPYINDPFILSLVNQTTSTQNKGSILLTVKKSQDSSIKKIKWQLNPVGNSTVTEPIVFTNNPIFNDEKNFAVLDESNIPAGTYEAQLNFIDENGLLYGPIVEAMTVTPGFVTDTWYGSDEFIYYSSEDEKNMFVVPSDTALLYLFPDGYCINPIEGDIALLWNYNENRGEYKVHQVDSSGNLSDIGYTFAKDVVIQDAFIDFETNDMYVISIDNTIIKYKAQSGYSETITNTVDNEDEYIITVAANKDQAFVLTALMGMSPNPTYKLYKFNNSGTELIPAGNTGLNLSSYAYQTMDPNFHMALSNGNLFISYMDNYSNIYCELLNETNDYSENVWSSAPCFANSSDFPGLMVNDIIAIPDAEQAGTINVYVLIGCLNIQQRGYQAFSYGGIIKFISTSTEGTPVGSIDQSYGPTYGTTSGIRGITPDYVGSFIYNKTVEDESAAFYNPIKIIGKSNGKYIVADDGAQFGLNSKEDEVESVYPKKRIVTVDLTAASFESFDKIQQPGVSFNNVISGNSKTGSGFRLSNLKTNSLNSQGVTSNYLYEIYSDYSNVGMDNEWGIDIEAFSFYGDYRYAFDDNGVLSLPISRDKPLHIYVQPHYWDVQYNAVLYCNGKDLNEGVAAGEEYYEVDSEQGLFTLKKPLPVMGNYNYSFGLEIVQKAYDKDSNPTLLKQNFLFPAQPDTYYWIREADMKGDFDAYLESMLICDYALIKTDVKYSDALFSTMFDKLKTYINTIDCPNLTLDLSSLKELTEIPAGMAGLKCRSIIYPNKRKYRSDPLISNIAKGAFSSNGINFEGDLELHKSVQSIENGAFAVPPRSITVNMDKGGYADTTENSKQDYYNRQKYNTKTMIDEDDAEYIYAGIKDSSYSIQTIVTCTKRDAPFTLDFTTSRFSYLKTIYDNAFKGLPLYTDSEHPLKLGTTEAIGQSAFEDTCVSSVVSGSALSTIGNKAFPAGTTLDLSENTSVGTWYYCTATADTLDDIWDYCWGSSITNVNSIDPSPSGIGPVGEDGDTREEIAEKIITKINQPYTFVFKKVDN